MVSPERPVRAGGGATGLVVSRSPQSVGVVRRFAVDTCVACGWDRCADTVALLVSEVATNAVLHADGPQMVVRVVQRGPRLRVEVDDASPRPPAPRGAPAEAEAGRGLGLVDALARRWGVEQARGGGKTVWFELDP